MKISSVTGMYADVRRFGESDILIDSDVDLGLEIELENYGKYANSPLKHKFWQIVEDGSLRNHGREFILAYRSSNGGMGSGNYLPVRGKDFSDALLAWEGWNKKYCEEYPAPQATKRTSVHVHVDVRDFTVKEISRFILLYATFEPTLFKALGNGREEATYCLPFFNNSQSRYRASRLINNDDSGNHVQDALQKSQKYESMNIHSIVQRGSIEFRIHHGTTDVGEMFRWVNILLCLRRAAQDENIQIGDYAANASDMGLINMVGAVFKEHINLIADHLDEELLLSGVRQAQDIVALTGVNKLNNGFKKQIAGKKAEKSILHEWAEANNRKVYT